MADKVVTHFYREFIADGIIKVDGKPEADVLKDFERELRRFCKQKHIYLSVDHRHSLLEQARYYRRRKSYQDACLYYATWFEHWINGILVRILANPGLLSREELKELIRGTNLRVKYECLPQLCSLPRIPATHCAVVNKIAELRNSYVHYKHTPEDVDTWAEEKKRWASNLSSVNRTISYLLKYEDKNIYGGHKHAVIPKRKQ